MLISTAYASPHPGIGTSALTSSEKNLFLARKGFQLGLKGTNWKMQLDESLSRGDEDSSWRFSNADFLSAQAHLKTDFLKAEMSLESYAKRWMRDYSVLGMDVMGSRVFSQNGQRGIVIDVRQPKKKLQLRQAVFMKKKSVVIVTCSDEQATFEKSINECNQLIKNFSWVAEPSSPQKAF
ncbi:MAG: hypothetical protein ACK5P7_10295 [Bdellovibrio sp.]